jgi:hypothetical protein
MQQALCRHIGGGLIVHGKALIFLQLAKAFHGSRSGQDLAATPVM